MSEHRSKDNLGDLGRQEDLPDQNLSQGEDLVMEMILENMNSTPLGQVLKRIACLPEFRKEKVLDLRRQIRQGNYDLSKRLDLALDKVLEDLTT